MGPALRLRALDAHVVRVDQEPVLHDAAEGVAKATAKPVQDDEPVLLPGLGFQDETGQQEDADHR